MSKTTLYLIRHGESIGNSLRTLLGHTDLGLTELGKSQAESCALALREIDFSAIYSSDLKRATETAIPHSRIHSLGITKSEELRELNIGEWENMHIDMIKEKYSDLYYKTWREDFFNFTAPGGESVKHLRERITKKLKQIAEAHLGENVLVVFHAAAIRAFWAGISQSGNDGEGDIPFPINASFSVVEYSEGHFTPLRYSVTEFTSS